MGVKFADKAATTITGDIAADATSVTVSSVSGFPTITGAGDYFYATIERVNDTTTYEVVKVTNLSSTTYTIDRSVESSSTFSAGDTFALRLNEHALVDPSLLQAGITTNTLTVDAGSSTTDLTVSSSTSAARLNVTSTATSNTQHGVIEIGGVGGGHIDIKKPFSDDFDLRLQHFSDDGSVLLGKTGDMIVRAETNGTAVRLQHEGANTKLETTDTGIDVTGTVTADRFSLTRTGGSTVESLGIYTDSNNDTFIEERDADNGSLKILGTALQLRADDLRLMNRAGTDVYFEGDADGAAKLFYDSSTHGTAKLETTSTGINVTGTVTADGLTVDGVATLTSGELANNLIIESTNSGTSGAPDIVLKRTKANNADNADADVVGNFQYKGKTDNGTEVTWAATRGVIKDATNASYEGQFEISVKKSGAASFKQVVVEPDLIKLQKPVDVTGTVTADGLSIGDASSTEGAGEAISIGAGGDLKLFHKSDVSYIHESGASALNIQAANINISTGTANDDTDPDEYYRITTTAGTGYVRLYHGETTDFNGHKFETTATGVDVTGTVTADALDIDGTVDIDTGNTIFDVDTGTSTVHFKSTNLGEQFLIENNNGGSTLEGAPDLTLFCNQPNDVSDGDTLGVINFKGLNDNASPQNYIYAKLFAVSDDVSDGDEKGRIIARIQHASGGTDSLTNALEIHKDGIDVTGEVSIGDASNAAGATNRLSVGAGDDLLIYHNGNNSYIKESNGSGSLTIQGQNIFIKNTDGTKNFIHTDSNEDVRLSFDGSTKLQTTTGGVFVTGAVVAGAQGATTGGQVKFREGTDNGTNTTILQAPADAGSGLTINLPSSAGTLALTSDIGFVAPTTVVGSAAISDMTSNISKKYVHTGGAVTLKFPNVTASSNLGNTWVVVNAGTDTLTFDRVTSGTSQFIKLNGSTVATAANTITLSKGGVAELTVTADNQIIIFGSGVI